MAGATTKCSMYLLRVKSCYKFGFKLLSEYKREGRICRATETMTGCFAVTRLKLWIQFKYRIWLYGTCGEHERVTSPLDCCILLVINYYFVHVCFTIGIASLALD